MSAEGLSVNGSSQQSWTSGPQLLGGGPLFSGPGPLIMSGLVNDTTPGMESYSSTVVESVLKTMIKQVINCETLYFILRRVYVS